MGCPIHEDPGGVYEDVLLSLHGHHQGDNAACALAAVEAFFAQPLDADVVTKGFASVTAPGRFEVVRRNPLVVLDGAHNPEGAVAAARTLREDFEFVGETLVVLGMLQPRDPSALFEALEIDRASVVVVCEPDSPRAIPTDTLATAARAFGVDVIVEADVVRAVDRALRLAGEDDAVLIAGSIYVVGAARTHLT